MRLQYKTLLREFQQIPPVSQMLSYLHHYFGTHDKVAHQMKVGLTTVWAWKTNRKGMNARSFKRLVILYLMTHLTDPEDYHKYCMEPVKFTVDKSE